MPVHENSLAAYLEEGKRISERAAAVYAWVCRHGRATDRQIMHGMGFVDPNKVRPRITELVDRGLLAEVDTAIDPETGKRVRVVDVDLKWKKGDLFQSLVGTA